jgi:hypothetical protein
VFPIVSNTQEHTWDWNWYTLYSFPSTIPLQKLKHRFFFFLWKIIKFQQLKNNQNYLKRETIKELSLNNSPAAVKLLKLWNRSSSKWHFNPFSSTRLNYKEPFGLFFLTNFKVWAKFVNRCYFHKHSFNFNYLRRKSI